MAAARRAWAADLLHVWFHHLAPADRFTTNPEVDAELTRRFASDWAALRGQAAANFLDHPRTALAAVLLFDQVPRNVHRATPLAFASDVLARNIAHAALARGWDHALSPGERQFLAMPLMHSEAIADQRQSLAYYARLGPRFGAPFARAHYRMIDRFGRFPHRNAVLGRSTTPDEKRFLDDGGFAG